MRRDLSAEYTSSKNYSYCKQIMNRLYVLFAEMNEILFFPFKYSARLYIYFVRYNLFC